LAQVLPRKSPQDLPFFAIHCGRRRGNLRTTSRLDLDETQHITVPGNQVQIAGQRPIIPPPCHHRESFTAQKKERCLLASITRPQMRRQF
jgi:hypothetical protein